MNAIKNIKKKIKNKIPIIGTLVSINDSSITELLCNIGFDFIWIDMEHTPIGKKDVNFHIMAYGCKRNRSSYFCSCCLE